MSRCVRCRERPGTVAVHGIVAGSVVGPNGEPDSRPGGMLYACPRCRPYYSDGPNGALARLRHSGHRRAGAA